MRFPPRNTTARERVVCFLLGVTTFPVLAAAVGLVAIFLAYASASFVFGLVAWVSAIAVTIVLLLRRAGRPRYVGYGIVAAVAVSILGVAAHAVLSSGGAEDRLADIANHSSTPIYYPGPSFHGHGLDDAMISSGNAGYSDGSDHSFDPGDRMDVGYGSTCSFLSSDETCGYLIDVQMYRGIVPFPPGFCSAVVEGPRGTVLMRERNGAWDALVGDVVLRVEEVDKQGMTDLVTALRVAGDPAGTTGSRLPQPDASTLHSIRNMCHQPGDEPAS